MSRLDWPRRLVSVNGMLRNMTMRTTISMPDDLWEKVEKQQVDTGASVSEIVRRALVGYFPPEKPKTKTMGRAVTKKAPATSKRVVKTK
jgi:metal-responsive CopG/Arc/MetJ family transcriptional regulator